MERGAMRGDLGERRSPGFRHSASKTRVNALKAPSGLRLSLLLFAFVLLPLAAQAQELPSRSTRIIVPNPPGGAGDISARLIGQKLSESIRQPVVVENQPGASGAIGMTMVKRAAPDGTTLGIVISLAQTIDLIQNKAASLDIVTD